METYFFDTYAFFEIIKGNPSYKQFEEVKAVTTIINLGELATGIRKYHGMEEAERYTKKYASFISNIELADLINAAELKFSNRKLSLADAIGYSVAKRLNVKFLTGDKEFRHMKNVEFVK